MHTSTIVLVVCCLAAVQASAIRRQGADSEIPKDTVEYTNNGFSVKSGYEGYLFNNQKNAVAKTTKQRKISWFSPAMIDVYKGMIMYGSGFLPAIGLKIVMGLIHFALALFLGIAATAATCTFTPLCTFAYSGPKPSILSDKSEVLPALQQALEVVARIPNLFKNEQSPVEPQPTQTNEESESTLDEGLRGIVEPRNPKKDVADQSQSLKVEQLDVTENETK